MKGYYYKVYNKQYYLDHKEHLGILNKKNQKEHPEKRRLSSLKCYYKNRERILWQKRMNRIETTAKAKIWRATLRTQVLMHYSKGTLSCVKCGFSDERALSIDHIEGGGIKHRKSLGISSGAPFYQWLKRNNFPEGYQTLCMNCQWIKAREQEYSDCNTKKPMKDPIPLSTLSNEDYK